MALIYINIIYNLISIRVNTKDKREQRIDFQAIIRAKLKIIRYIFIRIKNIIVGIKTTNQIKIK